MIRQRTTALKVSKYGVFSGPYFPAFSPNTGKYGPEKTSYVDTFHVLSTLPNCPNNFPPGIKSMVYCLHCCRKVLSLPSTVAESWFNRMVFYDILLEKVELELETIV